MPDQTIQPYFALGDFTERSLQYLRTLTGGAPIELTDPPTIFLSSPRFPALLTASQAEIATQQASSVIFRFHCARNVYNVKNGRTDFVVVGQAMTPEMKEMPFLPYFSWAVDPARSTTTRSFLVSLANSLQADAFELEVIPTLVLVDSPAGALYNEMVYSEAVR